MKTILQDRPEVLEGRTHKIETPCGTFYLTLNEKDGKLFETRMMIGKSGNCVRGLFQAIGILISLLLQTNIPREKIRKVLEDNLIGSSCGEKIRKDGQEFHSCLDYVVQKMFEDLAAREEIQVEEKAD